MNQVQVRILGIDDYGATLALWQRSGLSSLRPRGRDSRAAFVRLHNPTGPNLQTVLGLEEDGHLVGVVVATHDGRKGWINRLAVDPRHRHQGHAKRLISAAEQVLRAQGIDVIAALIERENEISMALFQQVGYQVHEEICYLSKRDSAEA